MTNKKPLLKWAGGKEKELPIIKKHLPKEFKRYVEPFVGGGAVYLNINCNESIINDKSEELILLYRMIKKGNKKFYKSLEEINKNWLLLEEIVINNSNELIDLYFEYQKDTDKLEELIDNFMKKHR